MDRTESGTTGRLEDAAEGVIEVGRFLGDAPKLLARGALLVEQLDEITLDGLVLAPDTVNGDRPRGGATHPLNTAALWIIAALLACCLFDGALAVGDHCFTQTPISA